MSLLCPLEQIVWQCNPCSFTASNFLMPWLWTIIYSIFYVHSPLLFLFLFSLSLFPYIPSKLSRLESLFEPTSTVNCQVIHLKGYISSWSEDAWDNCLWPVAYEYTDSSTIQLTKLSQTFVYFGNNLRRPFHRVRRRSSYRDHAIVSVAAIYGDSPEVPILHQAQSRC